MSAIARSRLFSIILKNNRRFYSDIAANPPREPIISSSSVLNNQPLPGSTPPPPPPPPSTPPPPPPSSTGTESKSWSFLKYTIIASLTGGVATAGYTTYAYTFDEVDEKTKGLRASANYTVGDDASALINYKHCSTLLQ